MNTKPTKAPKQAAILSENVHTDLDGIEVGSHVRWEGISLFEEGDGGLTTRGVRLFPIWDGNLAVVPLSLDPTCICGHSRGTLTKPVGFQYGNSEHWHF